MKNRIFVIFVGVVFEQEMKWLGIRCYILMISHLFVRLVGWDSSRNDTLRDTWKRTILVTREKRSRSGRQVYKEVMMWWLLVLCLDCLTLKLKALCSFEMSAAGCQLTQYNIPEDLHLKQHHLEDCKCRRSWAGKAVPWIWFGVDSVSVVYFIMNYQMVFSPFWCLLQ